MTNPPHYSIKISIDKVKGEKTEQLYSIDENGEQTFVKKRVVKEKFDK
jgi:hypothetical protein